MAEQQTASVAIQRLQRVLPLITEQANAAEAMYQKKYGAKMQFLELERERIEAEEALNSQRAMLKQAKADVSVIQNQIASHKASARKESLRLIDELRRQMDGIGQELVKAQKLHGYQTIRSPIEGKVQQLQVHTLGGAVQPAQVLMQIVPANTPLEVEAWVLNKDIGFVSEGQRSDIKIDTFNFTKYGLIGGKIESLSNDAVADEQQGLQYRATVSLDQNWIQTGNQKTKLSPGMSVAVDIRTGQRRIIEFFLSPLLRSTRNSLQER
ncbi:HlyD family type I secretion periplasmic adaptor subunit [Endozoicomonas sp. GU-1]|uniref:HlyD family type I secretion periplasmic adaptor subunit n=1 Tax=Endozoicomonas sp. GU-1 TaxID=3009078 RepID=UPI0022B30C8C|nr:HlyD family type I secretion periplasmic adaptor subunit [Endozoicomonas sp. GU-1]WBA81434.1 HlyD family type I secretion periplasmic adaptor subunit [Endozoicomonas sp. GU-1]WBA84381.1 HlyD family type I secretion periplasmic adaptor subunit [Endozoicomonas sp. GU-1]